MKNIPLTVGFVIAAAAAMAQTPQALYHEQWRPQYHFSPKAHWMNDPNGMVYYQGTYHLFFQYYPDSSVWGPMHWGHAVSTDLVHWEEEPISVHGGLAVGYDGRFSRFWGRAEGEEPGPIGATVALLPPLPVGAG